MTFSHYTLSGITIFEGVVWSVNMHVLNPRATKKQQQRGIANKPILEIKWSTKNNTKEGRRKGKKTTRNRQYQIKNEYKDCRLKRNHINNDFEYKASKHLNIKAEIVRLTG